MELPPYLRLEQSDDIETPSDMQTSSDNSGSIDGSVSNPLHTRGGTSSSGHSFILRVLNKESKVEITTLTASSTVSDLKSAICKHTQIPELNQRLIFSGKHLNPDNKQLREFNICSESSIHLFPRPTAAPIPQAADDSSVGITRILRVHRMSQPSQEGNLAGYDQGTALSVGLHQTVPEVRLWCYILFFYSFMTLFSHISFIANTGSAD